MNRNRMNHWAAAAVVAGTLMAMSAVNAHAAVRNPYELSDGKLGHVGANHQVVVDDQTALRRVGILSLGQPTPYEIPGGWRLWLPIMQVILHD